MNEALTGVVVSHGQVAQALVDAVRSISGIENALVPVSNEDCDRQALERRIQAAAEGRKVVLFVDLAGGSCTTTAARLAHVLPDAALVTGVNLPMLVDFVFHRDLTAPEAAERAVGAATRSIQHPS